MEHALKGIPVTDHPAPAGRCQCRAGMVLQRTVRGVGVSTAGVTSDGSVAGSNEATATTDAGIQYHRRPMRKKKTILDLPKTEIRNRSTRLCSKCQRLTSLLAGVAR
jgi:penicillin-binding protein 1A